MIESPLHFLIKSNAHLHYQNPYSILSKYLPLVKEEVNRLVDLGVLEPTKHATYTTLYFMQPKKDITIRFLTDFYKLNKNLLCKPFSLPKINNMI